MNFVHHLSLHTCLVQPATQSNFYSAHRRCIPDWSITPTTLPVGADACTPARPDAQPVCARPPGYAAAGIAERFSDNIQPLVGSTWPRPNEGVTYAQLQPTPSSGTQPFHPTGLPTAAMQPGDILPPPQPGCVNAPMPLHCFDGVQIPQQYGLSESKQRMQTMPGNYGIQPTLVHDDGSLALGRTQTYSAASNTAGESNAINLQSSVVTHGLGPSHISNFSGRSGDLGPRGPPLGPGA